MIALAVILPTFMEVLDTSIAAVALPYIAGSVSATNDEATWVLTSYLVANAVVLPASSWFSLRFGRKRFLLTCIGIFTVASFTCGSATSLGMILLARAVQGAGGGALQPISQAILLESFPPKKRGLAMALFGLGVVVAPVLGPTLGGWLTDTYSWRWAFYINIPVGILAITMIMRFVQDPPYIRDAKPGRFDRIGFGLLALWLALLQIILDKGQEDDWFGASWIRWATFILIVSFVAHHLGMAPSRAAGESACLPQSQFRDRLRSDRVFWSRYLRSGYASSAVLPGTAGIHRSQRRHRCQSTRNGRDPGHAGNRPAHQPHRQSLLDQFRIFSLRRV